MSRGLLVGFLGTFLVLHGTVFGAEGSAPGAALGGQDVFMKSVDSHQSGKTEHLLMAQTSEVTIMLEKKMSPEDMVLPEFVEPIEQVEPSSESKGPEEIGQTATHTGGTGYTQKPQMYEDLEDPFASKEEIPELKDPFEGYNRFMFDVNENLYDYVMEPVARGYRYVMPEDLRIMFGNVFDNALSPAKLVSSLFQGDLDKSGRVLGRLLINTTLGLGGLFDVAGQEWNIENVNEDFDQALGYHDVPTGPYIVLPILGPSTARDVVGRTVDSFLSPLFMAGPGVGVGAGVTMGETINETSFIIDDKEQLEESAIDEYESVRDFYHQYRHQLVKE